MSAEKPHKDNSGAMFHNSAKWIDQKPGRPDLSGEVTVAGKRWRVAAWHKTAGSGVEYVSLAFSEPQAQQPAKGKGKV